MTPDKESELLDLPADDVPRIEPDEYCRGKRTQRDDEGVNRFIGFCRNEAGKGTDHLGEGRCKFHGGCSPGAPKGNQHPSTHGLNVDPHHYFESLSAEEQEFVREISIVVEDRLRALAGEIDYLDRILARRIAIELHIVSRASDYLETEGLVQTIGNSDRNQVLLGEVRRRDRTIFEMIRSLGILGDPASRSAESIEAWRDRLGDK